MQEYLLAVKMDKKKIALFGILATLITSGIYINYGDNIYYCGERELALQCDKLSKLSDGVQTRCYFYDEEKEKDTYKVCSGGWVKFENQVLKNKDKIYICEKKNKLIQKCVSEEKTQIIKVSYT